MIHPEILKQPAKMIVTDLDGTLLNEESTVSEFTIQTLKRCRDIGIKVVYATGRGSSSKLIVPFELFNGYVVNNGAFSYERTNEDDEIIYKSLIHYKDLRPLLLACDRRGLKTAAQLDHIHYSNFDVSKEWPEFRHFEIVDFSKHEKDTEKMYAVLNNDEDVRIIEKHLSDNIYLTVSRDGFAQIMHINATKSNGVAALADYWDIDKSQIVAFGDDLNDIDLITYAGIGVAMQNSIDEVKEIADQICLDNENDGIAIWITENILNQ